MANLLLALGLKPLPGMALADKTDNDAAGDDEDDGSGLPTSPRAPTPVSTVSPQPAGAGTAAQPAAKAASPEQLAYASERTAVVKLRNELAAHPQVAHVDDKMKIADPALGAAAAAAAQADWPKAMAELATVRKACTEGKTLADTYAPVIARRAEANLLLSAAQTGGMSKLTAYPGKLASADTKMAPAVRNYAGATADLEFILTGLAPRFKKLYVDDVKPKVAALKVLDAATKIATAEIVEIEAMLAQQEAGIAGQRWRQVKLNAGLLEKRLTRAEKISSRRAVFDAERPKADIAVKAVEANGSAVAAPLALVRQQLREADAMASREGMRFEDAKDQVLAIVAACQIFDRLARDAVAYTRERGALAAQLATLRGQPAAARIESELDVVRGSLDEAARLAGDKGAPGTVMALGVAPAMHDIAAARVRLAQAREALATAKSLAEGMDGVVAMEELVKDKDNVTALRKGVEALARELASALKAKHAELARESFDAVAGALAEARRQIATKQTPGTARILVAGGQMMVEGRRIQIEHAIYLERVATLKKRMAQHQANKAQAAKIQAKVDDISVALFDADAAETAKDHAGAMAGLNLAETAAAAADAALVERAAFDKEANLAQLDLEKPAYAVIKVAQGKELTRARGQASVFDFAEAGKIVKAIRNAMGATDTAALATADPRDDKKLAKQAEELAAAGGWDELDALIKTLSPDTDKEVFEALAKARFQVDFDVQSDGHEQVSIQRMCALMKDIPKDVVIRNPSLKRIERRVTKADGSKQTAPFYRGGENLVVMNSRPGDGKKGDFQPGAKGRLPEREEACKPANDKPEELFDFNMLHELAHSIDDARTYMVLNGPKPDHGGWIEIGGDVEQIVEAVVANTGFGKEPAARQYVLDRILRNPATPPPKFTGDKERFEKFITAAQTAKVWDKQSVTELATLGTRVYQESYPHTWTSYLAAARKRGITSYQFRAPGEWFSDLYAAWKVGKLKAGHPSEVWLKKLKV